VVSKHERIQALADENEVIVFENVTTFKELVVERSGRDYDVVVLFTMAPQMWKKKCAECAQFDRIFRDAASKVVPHKKTYFA
jgi:hypothetical protein